MASWSTHHYQYLWVIKCRYSSATCSVIDWYQWMANVYVLLQTPTAPLCAKESLIISFSLPPTVFFPDVDVIFHLAARGESVDKFCRGLLILICSCGRPHPFIPYLFSPFLFPSSPSLFFVFIYFWVLRCRGLKLTTHNSGAATSADGICLPSSVTDPSDVESPRPLPEEDKRLILSSTGKETNKSHLRKPFKHSSSSSSSLPLFLCLPSFFFAFLATLPTVASHLHSARWDGTIPKVLEVCLTRPSGKEPTESCVEI